MPPGTRLRRVAGNRGSGGGARAPGATSAGNSVLECPPAFVAGQEYTCTIVAKDAFDNQVTTSGDVFVPTLSPVNPANTASTRNSGMDRQNL